MTILATTTVVITTEEITDLYDSHVSETTYDKNEIITLIINHVKDTLPNNYPDIGWYQLVHHVFEVVNEHVASSYA